MPRNCAADFFPSTRRSSTLSRLSPAADQPLCIWIHQSICFIHDFGTLLLRCRKARCISNQKPGEMQMEGLSNRVHVITGGYGGIAMATARLILESGGTIVLTGRSQEKGKAAIAALRAGHRGEAHFIELDVTDAAAVEQAAAHIESEIGAVKGLVANAAGAWPGAAFDLAPEDWRKTMAVVLDGAFYCAQSFGRRMRGRGGSIVLVSSIAASKVTWPPAVVSYSAGKAALSHLAALLGVEWASEGIRVNAIEPGHIDTEMTQRAKARRPEMMEKWLGDVPIGRLITPEECANAIAFLLSDLSSATTASVTTVDGGYSRR
ncbi:SDR family NAD(P)-dependent oxidoreductase [Sphingomonas colocasiae]|uniref:SDR family oxidoreductase n=1 Tax=Sphingomonas colocasiae TaxID=1848973 RepID=A0ABS7PTM7_9SPHN|nr:SDR family oxidoreductase [Sphingomonas colocasiae]MBY8824344.1 SDR family oxidoreductase [Sphingomonas colocasiae]